MPEFSVIVPVYNVEPYLRQCVDSILAQTFSDFEVILVDDGSPDGCGAICDEYAAKDSRVTVVHQQNAGLARARKSGLLRASADYICFVDSDDWVKEDWLQTIHQCLMEGNWPDMLVFSYVQDDGSTAQPLFAEAGLYDKARMESQIYPYMIWDQRKPFLTQLLPAFQCMKVTRRELLAEHFISDDAYIPLFEDVAMTYECLYNADSLYICPEALYVYRIREGSLLHHPDPDVYRKIKRSRDYMLEHLVLQAPELRVQVDAFFAVKFLFFLERDVASGHSTRQAARHLRDGLAGTGLAGDLSVEALPLRIRFFLMLLRHRAYLSAVVTYRLRTWLFNTLHI